jgi:hypothetical protein
MKLKLINKRPIHTMCKKLKTTDKLMRKQLIKPLQKKLKTSNKSKINDMLVPSKTRNKKKPRTPMLVPLRPSTKVSSYAGELLGDPQSSPKVQSLAGSVLRLTRLSEPWYFPGKMKP